MAKVAILAGSKSDQKTIDDVTSFLKENGVNFDAQVISAHRNRKKLEDYVMNSDADVFIGIAGLSAALPGAIASLTTKPVIGVPLNVQLGGLDSLLSTAQMPPGVPVACVGIDNGKNAAILAMEILALKEPSINQKLENYRKSWSK
ncbi:MAG: 5-(carboxyamino)imidazole ribonucleotide mutase [Thaumarchaeota archaeon]|nr:5-(carboxyamino)imidazole ribonucleotide mutase [Nitrososphaerota archaeon]